MVKSYDPKCFDLAETFLHDGLIGLDFKDRCHRLALEIQNTIEDFIEANPPKMEDRVGGVTVLASERI